MKGGGVGPVRGKARRKEEKRTINLSSRHTTEKDGGASVGG